MKLLDAQISFKDQAGWPQVLISEAGRTPVELVSVGSACQKIFQTLVLLHTLTAKPEPNKVFLIEEPEALLYPSLQHSFVKMLWDVCSTHNLQLIMTSNSSVTVSQFEEVSDCCFALSSTLCVLVLAFPSCAVLLLT